MKPSAAAPLPTSSADDLDKDKRRRRRSNRRPKQSSGDPVENGPGRPLSRSSSTPDVRFGSGGAAADPGGNSSGVEGKRSCGAVANGSRRRLFDPHLSAEAVKEGLEKGYVFRGNFRVNAYNRPEAYCTVDGLPKDILIDGVTAQNRAVEGDVVAVMLNPVSFWTKLKGSAVHSNNSSPVDRANATQGEGEEIDGVCKDKRCADSDDLDHLKTLHPVANGNSIHDNVGLNEGNQIKMPKRTESSCLESRSQNGASSKGSESFEALDRWCSIIDSRPSKRPTGKVVAIIEQSHRRDAVTGFLSIQQSQSILEAYEKQVCRKMTKRNRNFVFCSANDHVVLRPNDPRFSDMLVFIADLPDSIRQRVTRCDLAVEMDLVAARIENWTEDCLLPKAHVMKTLGHGGEIETQIAAIFFENKISNSGFSPESLSCLPDIPWKIPVTEFERRRDFRDICTFTIDPSSSLDLDDALSIEKISDDVFRVGIHIADASYFIHPGSALDEEARSRSTSVYVSQHKLPMLPPLLSEELASLNPGVDRLAFSLMWDISDTEGIINQWIGHSVIRSRCKLSYERVQMIIDGARVPGYDNPPEAVLSEDNAEFVWKDVRESVLILHKISKGLKENRFNDGALRLDSAKLVVLFDEYGTPYDGILSEQKESNSLVEEFMLLANRTVAEVISKAFHECSLLRRHPEPNMRKLKEFKEFCKKHGFELDISSSAGLHSSLSKIKEELKDDPLLFDILIFYASKPMQLAMYFCTGDLIDRKDEWAHYTLATPFYTHFTSPLRRYADIVVHRTLSAVLKAEKIFLQVQRMVASEDQVNRCFTGTNFNIEVVESQAGREALRTAALECKLPGTQALSEIAAHCNNKQLASRRAEESGKKVYLWAMLRNKENMVTEARVMGVGPKFMSVYIHRFSIERRIYYTDVEGLAVEWLENTATLVLDFFNSKRSQKKGYSENLYPLEHVVLLLNPTDLGTGDDNDKSLTKESIGTPSALSDTAGNDEILPATFPLTVQVLSTVPVSLHAVGGGDGPVDVGVRLFISSYFG